MSRVRHRVLVRGLGTAIVCGRTELRAEAIKVIKLEICIVGPKVA